MLLYRAVSTEEYLQLRQVGEFEVVAQSAEGKYFAENATDALCWGRLLFGERPFHILIIELPDNIVQQFYRWECLDNIGPARYADIEQLQGIMINFEEVKP